MPRPADESKLLADCHARAVELLQSNLTPAGVLAATPTKRARRPRLRRRSSAATRRSARSAWRSPGIARSSAPSVAGLETLAAYQAPNGQIPKFVAPDRREADFWYLGCIDSTLWWLIALALLDERLAQRGVQPRLAAPVPARGSACAPMARRAGASALSFAPAERGQRLGRHHAALGIRAVHERALVSREAAVRPAERCCDSRELQRPVPSVLGARSRSIGARACSTSTH